ncbi:MAG: glycosyltransferase family 2 protein [Atopobiaceae bacterium]|nr:glycosyltransferase family 2 protein [Atopobiaceae bacterium]
MRVAEAKAPKLSSIMPVYNVDRYLTRAIESLQAQSFNDYELLIVDDGSTDRSGRIADHAAEFDFRIEVIHQENAGAAAARNTALDRARGTYVYFMDADDWAEPEMLGDMVEAMERNNLELFICPFYIETFFDDEGIDYLTELKAVEPAIYLNAQSFRLDAWRLFDQNLLYTPWNKLFLRSRIEELGIRFRNTFMDDFPFVLDYIRDVERVGVGERPYYHFTRAREESETTKWRPDLYAKREEEHGWMLDLYGYWGLSEDSDSMEMVHRRYIERLVGCIESVCSPQCTLSPEEKRQAIAEMITSARAQESVAIARPRSQIMKLMLMPIRRQDVGLAYSEGKFISFVRSKSSKLFANLKANR